MVYVEAVTYFQHLNVLDYTHQKNASLGKSENQATLNTFSYQAMIHWCWVTAYPI